MSIVPKKHHKRLELCTTRPPYRQGRRLKAIKVYTVSQESKYLLIHGVPILKVDRQLLKLCGSMGEVAELKVLPDYPAEQFTQTYLCKYNSIQATRHAKRKLDDHSFYGGVLHVCYAPEYESIEDTREKLQQRRKDVARRVRILEAESKAMGTSGIGKLESNVRGEPPSNSKGPTSQQPNQLETLETTETNVEQVYPATKTICDTDEGQNGALVAESHPEGGYELNPALLPPYTRHLKEVVQYPTEGPELSNKHTKETTFNPAAAVPYCYHKPSSLIPNQHFTQVSTKESTHGPPPWLLGHPPPPSKPPGSDTMANYGPTNPLIFDPMAQGSQPYPSMVDDRQGAPLQSLTVPDRTTRGRSEALAQGMYAAMLSKQNSMSGNKEKLIEQRKQDEGTEMGVTVGASVGTSNKGRNSNIVTPQGKSDRNFTNTTKCINSNQNNTPSSAGRGMTGNSAGRGMTGNSVACGMTGNSDKTVTESAPLLIKQYKTPENQASAKFVPRQNNKKILSGQLLSSVTKVIEKMSPSEAAEINQKKTLKRKADPVNERLRREAFILGDKKGPALPTATTEGNPGGSVASGDPNLDTQASVDLSMDVSVKRIREKVMQFSTKALPSQLKRKRKP